MTQELRTCPLGDGERCTRSDCLYWEPGGATVWGRCAFENVDLRRQPDLVAALRRIRDQTEDDRSAEDEAQLRHLFHRLLSQGRE